ncbi:hypothetical protein PGO05_03635 [Klebsiella aerogenes]|nr:hypothetical protein [Klebsiella aerogenes]
MSKEMKSMQFKQAGYLVGGVVAYLVGFHDVAGFLCLCWGLGIVTALMPA